MKSKRSLPLWNACIGNLFEHYDTALLALLSPFLAPLIFPSHDPLTALILTYAIFPLAMVVRPLGALIFGYIGDTYGRERALFLSIAGMGCVSGCIAFTPTYLQAGLFAPLLFGIGKALQNFFAAGEGMGGAIYILEHTPKKQHDLLSSLYGASAMGGYLLASWGVYLISSYSFIDPGWRYLYLCGCITALFSCLFRRSTHTVNSTGKFSDSAQKLLHSLWSHRHALLMIALSAGFSYATYSIALVLMNGLIPLITSFSKTEIIEINTYLLIFDFAALPLFGWIASKVSREKLMLSISLTTVLLGIPLMNGLESASLMGIVAIRMVFVIIGVAFCAPFHAWAQELVPPDSRYAVISLGYALGAQLLGSPTAAFSLWCFQQTGIVSSIAWYWMLLATAASLSIFATMTKRQTILTMS